MTVLGLDLSLGAVMKNLFNVAGKVALVTGGLRGIKAANSYHYLPFANDCCWPFSALRFLDFHAL